MKKVDLQQVQSWYAASESSQSIWKNDSWYDCAFVDGVQWSEMEKEMLQKKGILPLTINRVFSVIQAARGHQINNRTDIIAKGRTQHDQEMSQIMSQAIEYVGDKNDMDARISAAFDNQITAGCGYLGVTINPDPTAEPVLVKKLPWYSIGWDIYSTEGPWLKKGNCRYVYYHDWKDLDSLIERFPKAKNDLEGFYEDADSWNPITSYSSTDFHEDFLNNANMSGWTSTSGETMRKRIKVVDMWYPQLEERLFAKMPSGQVVEIDDDAEAQEIFGIIDQAESVFKAPVAKMQLMTFAGRVQLQSCKSPLAHNDFPFVPFVSYTDRYHQPYGIPRNLLESSKELNKRRSMALMLISNRRVIMERGTAANHNQVYEQANRKDGLIVVEDGKKDTLEIMEMADLAPAQMELMRQSEQEIKEVSGTNDESLGYQTKVQSGVAIEEKKESSVTMLSPLFDNLSRSKRILGERIMATVQQTWTGQRVLLVTDSVTGAEKFMNLNEPIMDKLTGQIIIKNNITAGTFDVVVDDAGNAASERERMSEFFLNAMNKAPEETAAPLLSMALQLSNMPYKDQMMRQLRNITKVDPIDTFLTQAELDEKDLQEQQAIEEQEAKQAEYEDMMKQVELEERKAKIAKIYADIEAGKQQLKTTQAFNADKVDIEKAKQVDKNYLEGVRIAQDIERMMGFSQPKLPMSQPTNQTYPSRGR